MEAPLAERTEHIFQAVAAPPHVLVPDDDDYVSESYPALGYQGGAQPPPPFPSPFVPSPAVLRFGAKACGAAAWS